VRRRRSTPSTTALSAPTLVAPATFLLVALLLAGCGEDPKPRADTRRSSTCQTEGTVASGPSATLRAAVAPYLRDGERFRLEKRVTDTATVLLVTRGGGVGGRVTLVKVAGGWAPTTVERCQPR